MKTRRGQFERDTLESIAGVLKRGWIGDVQIVAIRAYIRGGREIRTGRDEERDIARQFIFDRDFAVILDQYERFVVFGPDINGQIGETVIVFRQSAGS